MSFANALQWEVGPTAQSSNPAALRILTKAFGPRGSYFSLTLFSQLCTEVVQKPRPSLEHKQHFINATNISIVQQPWQETANLVWKNLLTKGWSSLVVLVHRWKTLLAARRTFVPTHRTGHLWAGHWGTIISPKWNKTFQVRTKWLESWQPTVPQSESRLGPVFIKVDDYSAMHQRQYGQALLIFCPILVT